MSGIPNPRYQVLRYISVPKNTTAQVLGVFPTNDAAQKFIDLASEALVLTENISLRYAIVELDSRGRAPLDPILEAQKLKNIQQAREIRELDAVNFELNTTRRDVILM